MFLHMPPLFGVRRAALFKPPPPPEVRADRFVAVAQRLTPPLRLAPRHGLQGSVAFAPTALLLIWLFVFLTSKNAIVYVSLLPSFLHKD